MLRDTRDAAGLAGQMLTASFVSPYPASAPVVQVTKHGRGVEGEGAGGGEEGERNADAVCSRTGFAAAITLTCLPGWERRKSRLLLDEGLHSVNSADVA